MGFPFRFELAEGGPPAELEAGGVASKATTDVLVVHTTG